MLPHQLDHTQHTSLNLGSTVFERHDGIEVLGQMLSRFRNCSSLDSGNVPFILGHPSWSHPLSVAVSYEALPRLLYLSDGMEIRDWKEEELSDIAAGLGLSETDLRDYKTLVEAIHQPFLEYAAANRIDLKLLALDIENRRAHFDPFPEYRRANVFLRAHGRASSNPSELKCLEQIAYILDCADFSPEVLREAIDYYRDVATRDPNLFSRYVRVVRQPESRQGFYPHPPSGCTPPKFEDCLVFKGKIADSLEWHLKHLEELREATERCPSMPQREIRDLCESILDLNSVGYSTVRGNLKHMKLRSTYRPRDPLPAEYKLRALKALVRRNERFTYEVSIVERTGYVSLQGEISENCVAKRVREYVVNARLVNPPGIFGKKLEWLPEDWFMFEHVEYFRGGAENPFLDTERNFWDGIGYFMGKLEEDQYGWRKDRERDCLFPRGSSYLEGLLDKLKSSSPFPRAGRFRRIPKFSEAGRL